jgi:hypothetical protein
MQLDDVSLALGQPVHAVSLHDLETLLINKNHLPRITRIKAD